MTDERSTKKPKFVGENKTYQSSIACLDLYLIKRAAVPFCVCMCVCVVCNSFSSGYFGIALALINEINSQESFVSFCLQCIARHNLDPKIYFDAGFCL